MRVVVDSSTVLSVLLTDEDDGISRKMADAILTVGAIAPPLWRYEVQNGLLMALRRKRVSEDLFNQALSDADALDVSIIESPASLGAECALARTYELTAYDAAYLELAARSGSKLMTRDARLADSARVMNLLWESE